MYVEDLLARYLQWRHFSKTLGSIPPLPPLPSPPLSLLSLTLPPFFSPLRSRPLNLARRSGGALQAPPARSGAQPQPKSNLVHFGLKIRHLVVTILMIFLRINWPNFVQNQYRVLWHWSSIQSYRLYRSALQ